jgi:hypothetical protein
MPCHKRTRKKIMDSIRRKHPGYGLKRRKRMTNAIIYGRKH